MGGIAVGTAGSSGKRAFLRAYASGVGTAVNSRNVEFSSELSLLGGVDIVLNSLTSAGMLAASLACLRQDGAFVEVGKRDIWSRARVAQVRAALSGHRLRAIQC